MQDGNKKKRSFVRSPSYPSTALKEAINLAKIIKDKEGGGQHYLSPAVIAGHWGYSPKSSVSILKIAALKKFGLIKDRGSGKTRKIGLTQLANKILFYISNEDTGPDYYKAIADAAMKPSIHKELWDKYNGNLPSDMTLKKYLVIGREGARFSENAVDDFIRNLRGTISFAKLTKYDTISGHDEDKLPLTSEDNMESVPTCRAHSFDSTSKVFTIPIMLPSGKTGQFQIPHPLTESEWELMTGFLKMYKPSLVVAEPENNDAAEH